MVFTVLVSLNHDLFSHKLSLNYDIWTGDGVTQRHIHTVSWHWPQAPLTLVGCTFHLFVRSREHLKWHALMQFISNLSSSVWSPCMVSCMHVRDRGRACDPCLVMCGILALSYHPHSGWFWSVVLNWFFFRRIQTFCDPVQTCKALAENRCLWYTLVFLCVCKASGYDVDDCQLKKMIVFRCLSDWSMANKISMINKRKKSSFKSVFKPSS